MTRVRLASLLVAAGLVFSSGCCFPSFCGFRHRHNGDGCGECACGGGDIATHGLAGLDGPIVGTPDGLNAVPLMPPPGDISTQQPPIGPPPRVVPIPQANPIPYTPGRTTQWLRRPIETRP
jgi:hypothetical protein